MKEKNLYNPPNKQNTYFRWLRNLIQVRCGLSGINEEKNVETAVSKTRDVVTWLSPIGPGGGGGG